jgi:hypothetical protein
MWDGLTGFWYGVQENVGATFFMWSAGHNLYEVFGGWAAYIRWVAVLEFIRCEMFSDASALCFVIPVDYVRHGCLVSKEYAREGVRVKCRRPCLGFLCRDLGSKGE